MRKLLLPISLLYSFVLFLRHKLYDWHFFKSKNYDIPNICVGNLNLGGTGKTPHIEYLIRLLANNYKVAVLSRGYGRKSKGFLIASKEHTSADIGDEPMQYFSKFNNIKVAVDEDRCNGIEKLISNQNKQVILLDDAFQHRKIRAGLNILLTDYYSLYSKDYLFPSGKLRDIRYAAKRANIIVVTKSPRVITSYNKKDIRRSLKPLSEQKIFYSYIEYQDFEAFSQMSFCYDTKDTKAVLLFCGIANTFSLEEYLKSRYNNVQVIKFSDHHNFTEKDIDYVIEKYNDMIGKRKLIVTTEKDAMRLNSTPFIGKFDNLPLFTIPIKVKFHKEDSSSFDEEIISYIEKQK